MRFASLFFALCTLFSLALALPMEKRATYPENDPWYNPDSGWESTAPGTILRSRKIQAALLTLLPTLSVSSYQLLYRTNDQNNTPKVAVTTVFVPLFAQKDKVLAFAVAEDAAAEHCAPSYQYQLGSDSSNLLAHVELLLAQVAMSQRWIVTVPDYEGRESAYAVGRYQAPHFLDAIRATKNFDTLGLASNVKFAMWGYSGGSTPVSWSAAIHKKYAPELNIVGAAHGGTVANLTATVEYINGGLFTGFIPVSLAGLSVAYPVFKSKIEAIATQAYYDVLKFATSKCAVTDIIFNLGKDFINTDKYVKGTGQAFIREPEIKSILDSLTLGAVGADETPDFPVMVYHAHADQILPFGPAEQVVQNWCNHGARVRFVTNADNTVGHGAMEVYTIPRSIAFLKSRFNEESFPSGCEEVKVGIVSLADAIADSWGQGVPFLVPLLAVIVAAYQALPGF